MTEKTSFREIIEDLVPEENPNLEMVLEAAGTKVAYKIWRLGAIQALLQVCNKVTNWDQRQRTEARRVLLEAAYTGLIPARHIYISPHKERREKGDKRPEFFNLSVMRGYRGELELMAERGINVWPAQIVHREDDFKWRIHVTAEGPLVDCDFSHSGDADQRGDAIGGFILWTRGGNTFGIYHDRPYFESVKAAVDRYGTKPRSGTFALQFWKVTLVHRAFGVCCAEGLPVLSADRRMDDIALDTNAPPPEPPPAAQPEPETPIEADPVAVVGEDPPPDNPFGDKPLPPPENPDAEAQAPIEEELPEEKAAPEPERAAAPPPEEESGAGVTEGVTAEPTRNWWEEPNPVSDVQAAEEAGEENDNPF